MLANEDARAVLTFAASRFLIPDRVLNELREVINRLISEDIKSIYFFGSFASGVPTPKSDVDLLIVTDRADTENLQTELLSVSVPVDCHFISPAGFEKESRSGKGVVGAVLRSGIRLL